MRHRLAAILLTSAALVTGGFALNQAVAAPDKAAASAPARQITATRRLTESQYRNTVRDLFGADIKINGRFEPERREEGLLAIGATQMSISGAGFEQYYSMAKSIADQAYDPAHRAKVDSCTPADPAASDPKCVERLVREKGLVLFRRPLTDAEVRTRIAVAAKAAGPAKDHYAGQKLALVSLLTAPEFLFRVERAEPDPANAGQLRYDGYTKAARLSYLMWDTAPDAQLLKAAETGAIHQPETLKAEVARLTASPRLEGGTRAFFADMLQLDLFETLTKDTTIYPKFSAAFVTAAQEQTLKTVVDLLLTQKGDYRDIFTTRTRYLNRLLASVHQRPMLTRAEWVREEISAGEEAAGLLTQPTFLSLHSHPGRTSPTKRGVALNEIFLCSPTPPPPPDVDFSRVQDSTKGTVRGRLTDHMNNPGCAGCHRMSDPPGFALERFDTMGQRRMLENGQPIDVSAELMGKTFTGANELGTLLRDNPRAPRCLVRNVYAYGTGHAPDPDDDEAMLQKASAAFAQSGYRFPDLLAQVAASPDFFKVIKPKAVKAAPPQPAATVAAAAGPSAGGR